MYFHFREEMNSILGNKDHEDSTITKLELATSNLKLVTDLLNCGEAKYASKDYEGTITDCSKAIQILLDLGYAKDELENCEDKIANCAKSISLKDPFAIAYSLRGLSKCDLGDYKGAIADYDQAIQFKPDFANVYSRRGVTKSDLEDYEGAITDYTQAITLKPDDSFLYIVRANAKINLGDYTGAIADYNRALELPDVQQYVPYLRKVLADIEKLLGAYYVSEGKWYEGLNLLQSSLDYYRQIDNLEQRADLLAQIARVQLLLGDWDKARMLYRDALRLYIHLGKKEGIANCHLALGRMMLQLNYIEDAQKELETACILFDECGLSQRQAEAEEVLEVVSQFKYKQVSKV